MTSRLFAATSRSRRPTVSCTWCRLRSAMPQSSAFIAASAALIASRALCASSSISVLLDLGAWCFEERVVLAVPVQVDQHIHDADPCADDETAHGSLLQPCPVSTPTGTF